MNYFFNIVYRLFRHLVLSYYEHLLSHKMLALYNVFDKLRHFLFEQVKTFYTIFCCWSKTFRMSMSSWFSYICRSSYHLLFLLESHKNHNYFCPCDPPLSPWSNQCANIDWKVYKIAIFQSLNTMCFFLNLQYSQVSLRVIHWDWTLGNKWVKKKV